MTENYSGTTSVQVMYDQSCRGLTRRVLYGGKARAESRATSTLQSLQVRFRPLFQPKPFCILSS
jgi:lipocalin